MQKVFGKGRHIREKLSKKGIYLMRISDIYRTLMLENIDIKYFEELDAKSIPQCLTGADVFHTKDSKIFAIHGHMNSKARRKEDFMNYLESIQ